ncbi:molybdopterin molybdotransferase MoeA [Gordonia sp. HY002]|uniref:molybdopterin molybdotransferase MoeA n=1 Tax=Gordonia zhenghanii TaxID=2911516 RepID=UPI001EF08CEF|nr:gephyrin-like molybdotransferase Glp [Gordonia zhenghanii]MCF8571764.1 molybdopterin molybdotransferase MoeA [Gordonia zhenghanii]MCF8604911.1 molybdopterin molybdotransferase MoeA [Gordonia zhenghanii]
MITVAEHRARVLAETTPTPVVTMSLADAEGRVLAADVASRWPTPLFDNSGMDGYAVRAADAAQGAVLRVVADVPAGSGLDPSIGVGEAARIMTGAPVPSDADTVVPLEHTDLGTVITAEVPAAITITREPTSGAHVRRAGEDSAAGVVAVTAGQILGPWQLSSIASAGHTRVSVHRAPRVAVISTGSELIDPAGEPARGQIPESNSVLLAAAVRAAGADVVTVATVADDEAALRALLADVDADVIVLSGGASVGAFDVVKAVLDGTGTVTFGPVAMQPGKPQGFGTDASGRLVFGLPGNPVGVAAGFEAFVRPALLAMAGRTDIDRPRVIRTAATGWRCPAGRAQFLPAVIDDDTVRPATSGGSGSHLVTSLALAHALAVVPAEVDHVSEGDAVEVMVLS